MWDWVVLDARGMSDDNEDDGEVELRVVVLEVGACASRFLPNAKEKIFPPIIGEIERNPQFCEKCAAKTRTSVPEQNNDR